MHSRNVLKDSCEPIKICLETRTGEELQMVSTICIRIFRLKILEHFSKRSVYFEMFWLVELKLFHQLHCDRNFRHFLVTGKQPRVKKTEVR